MADDLDRSCRQATRLPKQWELGMRLAIARVDHINPRRGGLKHGYFLRVTSLKRNLSSWPQLKTALAIHGIDRAAELRRLRISLSKMLDVWPEQEADLVATAALLVHHGADANDCFAVEQGGV
ncbi:hypothetical protein [Yoonia sediminilitoris]|uniref:Uncharacterized protein n=1 Tax=Yoonia sediminilitoris TaxID=1286148 RepID=A0A2T6K7G7_9RHOB|nr:hypothetical protein [Yoonia sediminilitoris]PUB10659.1 hypothetical protein C8N45_1172 [Yoonia sediminilitoris]RCW90411.1 hypothetical protein DFP92_1172 [Yoonia sediminilitoris]